MVCVLHHTVTSDEPKPEFIALWEITSLGDLTPLITRAFYLKVLNFRWPQAHAPPVLSAI